MPHALFAICCYLFTLFSFTSSEISHTCIHDTYILSHDQERLYTQSPQLYSAHNNGSYLTSISTPTSSYMRILLDTTYLDADEGYSCFHKGDKVDIDGNSFTCSSDDILTSDKKAFLRDVLLPAANERLSAIFKVISTDGPMFLFDSRCGFQGGVAIPTDYTRKGEGVAADIVVFITSRPIATPHVLAFGGQCQEDQYGRPIAGHLNFSPSRITVNPSSRDSQLGIILHELTHVLGFSYGKFGRFNNPTRGLTPAYTTVTSHAMAHDQTAQVTVVNTPHVLDWIQHHFGCDSMNGAPLEDGGGSGTRLSHWEKRVFMNEYMTGESTNNPVLSGLTMALFEDSGWYQIDYSTAEDLMWGKNEGCSFVQDSCAKWPHERGYFCSDERPTCSFDLQAKGHCGVAKHSTALPLGAQYFDNDHLGGGSELADYCPYVVPGNNAWCFDLANQDLPSVVNNGETFCPNCKCFESSLVKDLPFSGDVRLSCYQTACANSTYLKVRVGTLWYDCPPETSVIVEGYGGSIFCPKAAQVHALCGDVPASEAWPTISFISPTSGSPGTHVTIYGTGFTNNTQVVIHSRCKDVHIVSSEEIIAVVPVPDDIENPAHILAEVVDVIVIDDGRTAEKIGSFKLSGSGAGTGLSYIIVVIAWAVKHWLACITVVFAIATGCVYWYKRYRSKRSSTYRILPINHEDFGDL